MSKAPPKAKPPLKPSARAVGKASTKAARAAAKPTQKPTPKTTQKQTRKPIEDRAKVPSERPGQPGGRRDTNRKERTKGIAEAALVLFLERGIEAVTIEDITKQANVAKGSFYRYFDDKTALVESLFSPVAALVVQTFDDSLVSLQKSKNKEEALASYDVIAQGLGTIFLTHGDVVQLYLAESKGPLEGARGPARRLANLVTEKAIAHTKLAHEKGLLRPFPPEMSSLAVIGTAERLLHAVLVGEPMGVEPWEIPGHVVTLILDGIRAP